MKEPGQDKHRNNKQNNNNNNDNNKQRDNMNKQRDNDNHNNNNGGPLAVLNKVNRNIESALKNQILAHPQRKTNDGF
jgi:hypothetical protein